MTCIPDKERPGEKRLWTEGGRPLASQQHWTFRRWRIPTHPVFGRRSVAPPRTPGSIGTIRSRKAMPIAQTDARRSGFCSPNLGPRIKISGHPGRSASFFEVYLFGLVLGALADGVDGTDVRLSARRNALLVFRILQTDRYHVANQKSLGIPSMLLVKGTTSRSISSTASLGQGG